MVSGEERMKKLSRGVQSELYDLLMFADQRGCGRCLNRALEDLDVSDWWFDEIVKKLSRKRWSHYATEKDDLMVVAELIPRLVSCRSCGERIVQQFGEHLFDVTIPQLSVVIKSM
jgi:hypothetical protein